MMRMLIQAFTKGKHGSHHLIADVGTVDKLKDVGVHRRGCQNLYFQTHTSQREAQTLMLAGPSCLAGQLTPRTSCGQT